MEVRVPEDLYLMVVDLIIGLKRDGASGLAAILDHRMHKVAWTSASELLEELRAVLGGTGTEPMTEQTRALLTRVTDGIDALLGAR